MTTVVLATAVTANGPTTPVAVAQSRCYTAAISVTVGATVSLEVSVDGTNYFTPFGLVSICNVGGQGAWRLVDTPVQNMRLNISGMSSGSVSGTSIST